MTNGQEPSAAPNGFPPAPAWAWTARVAVFPGEGIDGGNESLLDLTDAEIDAACARFAARGVTLLQAAGFHPRMMWIPPRTTHAGDVLAAPPARAGADGSVCVDCGSAPQLGSENGR